MASNRIRIYQNAAAIVTGGASGIGRALAMELSRRGAEVVLADRQIEMAQDVADQIRAAGGRATALQVDVTDFPAVDRLVQETVTRVGRLDYMFNNAGIVIGGTMYDLTIDDWNKIIDVNLRGVIHGAHAACSVMKNQGFGHIVNTASMAGLMVGPLNIAYTVTKHAVVGFSQTLRVELAHWGIRVSVLCPGLIRTPILEGGKHGRININIPLEKRRDVWEKIRPMDPEVLAVKVLNAVAKNQAIIVVPAYWKMIWWLNRLSPTLGMFFARNLYAKIRKEFDLK